MRTFFLVIDNFSKNLHPLFKMYSLFFVFFFLCLCFCFLSCFYVLKNKKFFKFSSDYWGGQKRGFAPILIIGGRMPGLPPESTPMVMIPRSRIGGLLGSP